MTLRTKIQLFTSLFMVVLVLFINTSIYFLFYKTSANSELDQLTVQVNTIVETLNANPDIPKNELLQAFLPTNGMIRVIQENGEQMIPTLMKKREYRDIPIVFNNAESREIIKNEIGTNIAFVSKPIIWENGDVVLLQVSNHLVVLQETMKTLLYVLIIASVTMLIPTVIAGRLLSGFLLKPIKALTETMKENTKSAQWKKIQIENRSKDELYEMEKTFNEMIDHLKDNFQKQEVFVSDASHELRTPISIIKSYAQLLERRGKTHPEVFEESIHAIDSEADRMHKLVNQMLLLAKSKDALSMEVIDFNGLCTKTVKTFKEAYNREITLNSIGQATFINGNEEQMEQVIYILLDNTIKYTEGSIELEIIIKGEFVYLHVTDYGQGISEEEQKHIFNRFYRIDKARNRETGGTGLGLAIAKKIIETHGGNLSVQSSVGGGSTFTLKFPSVK